MLQVELVCLFCVCLYRRYQTMICQTDSFVDRSPALGCYYRCGWCKLKSLFYCFLNISYLLYWLQVFRIRVSNAWGQKWQFLSRLCSVLCLKGSVRQRFGHTSVDGKSSLKFSCVWSHLYFLLVHPLTLGLSPQTTLAGMFITKNVSVSCYLWGKFLHLFLLKLRINLDSVLVIFSFYFLVSN